MSLFGATQRTVAIEIKKAASFATAGSSYSEIECFVCAKAIKFTLSAFNIFCTLVKGKILFPSDLYDRDAILMYLFFKIFHQQNQLNLRMVMGCSAVQTRRVTWRVCDKTRYRDRRRPEPEKAPGPSVLQVDVHWRKNFTMLKCRYKRCSVLYRYHTF